MYEKPMQPVAKAYIVICEYIHLCINTYKSFSFSDFFLSNSSRQACRKIAHVVVTDYNKFNKNRV